jgi:sugar phosphate isomerase/epimerase
MKIAMATANLYQIPFEKALNIIQKAGYEYIELDGYWKGGDSWEVAQHIKDSKPKDVIRMVRDSGLKIASFHDMGGVIEDGNNTIISQATREYLSIADIPCVILHTPHYKTTDLYWWKSYIKTAVEDISQIADDRIICIENMTPFQGYMVPLIDPVAMLAFCEEAHVYSTIDTTHYAQSDIDIVQAATVLRNKVRTLHLSDYLHPKSHVFLGEGQLDFARFFKALDLDQLYLATIECSIPWEDESYCIQKAAQAKVFVEKNLNAEQAKLI